MKKLKFISVFAAVVFMTLILAISSSAATGLSDSTIYVGATTTASVDVLSGTASVTWSCIPSGIVSFENNSLGSYSCTVNVIGNLPGNATIRAVVTDAYGNTSTTTVGTITVVLEDGIYRIKNNYTDQNFTGGTYYLRAQPNSSSATLSLVQHSQNNFGNIDNQIFNYWRIEHLGNGEYLIKCLADESYVLEYSNNKVWVYKNEDGDLYNEIKWCIQGYNIKPKSNTAKCLSLASTSPSGTIYEGSVVYNYFNLQVGMIGDMAFEKWTFEEQSVGFALFKDKSTGRLHKTFLGTKLLETNTVNFSELGYEIIPYCYDDSDQPTFSWSSGDESVAEVNGTTGKLTLKKGGRTKITVAVQFESGTPYLLEYTLDVNTIEDGTYFIKNMGNMNNMDIDKEEITVGDHVLNQAFNYQTTQKWEVSHNNSNIYTISFYNSEDHTRYYLGIENDLEQMNAKLVLRTGNNITDGMKWYFEKGTDGYRLAPLLGYGAGGYQYAIAPSGSNIVTVFNLSSSSHLNEWGFFDTYFTIVNYYDVSFTGSNAYLQEYIEDANDFVSTVMEREFGLEFRMESVPIYNNTIIPSCTGAYNQCNSSCGSCEQHHKNILNISNTMYNMPRKNNHVYVMWSNKQDTFCETVNGSHSVVNSIAATVIGRPVIQFINITGIGTGGDTITDTRVQQQACMAISLLHEIMHTMGLLEQYVFSWHEKDGGYRCVMELFEKDCAVGFYRNLLNNDDNAMNAFCAECSSKIDRLKKSGIQYIGNLGGEQ